VEVAFKIVEEMIGAAVVVVALVQQVVAQHQLQLVRVEMDYLLRGFQ
jgi:hypothetical protein